MSFILMHKSKASYPQKRKGSETSQENTTKPQVKRQKLDSRGAEIEADSAYWDSLSRIWLTKRALRELDHRNQSQAALQRACTTRRDSHQIASSIEEFYSNCNICDLKNLKILAKKGGPDLSDLKGYPAPLITPEIIEMSASRSNSRRRRGSRLASSSKLTGSGLPATDTIPKTETSGPYDNNFQQKLVDGGVYPYAYIYPDGRDVPRPDNWQEINSRLKRHRPSLSSLTFSDKDHQKFARENARVAKEKKATKRVIPIIAGEDEDDDCTQGDIFFTNLAPLVETNLTVARPDLYYGARPEQLRREVRDMLSRQIIPSKQDHLPMVPNFFLEAKGPDGSMAVANRQACYDGALGARGILSLQSYGHIKPIFDNNSYTISSTYYCGMLTLYTTHMVESDSRKGRPGYYMNLLRSFSMIDSAETFRQGATAFRNARDLATEWRDKAINQANERAIHGEPKVLDTTFGLTYSSTTSSSNFNLSMTRVVRQESRTSLDDHPNIDDNDDSESSPDPIAPENRIPIKRSNRELKRAYRRQHRRQDAGGSASDNLDHGP